MVDANYMNNYMKRRYKERRALAEEYLGGKCSICGSTSKLEFDHVHSDSKLYNISDILLWSKNILFTELDKCQLLCHTHHLMKTLEQTNRKSAIGTHGTTSSARYCRCDSCLEAKRNYNKHYRKRISGALPSG